MYALRLDLMYVKRLHDAMQQWFEFPAAAQCFERQSTP